MAEFLIDQLVEMGFLRHKAQVAVEKTNATDTEAAVSWLIEHNEDEEYFPNASDDISFSKDTENNTVPLESTSAENTEHLEAASNTEQSERLEPNAENDNGDLPSDNTETTEVKSYKCDVCGKLMKLSQIEYHMAKTKHDKFSESTEEIKPLTPEQIEEQKKILEQKIRDNRVKKAREEEEHQRRMEIKRRIQGRDMVSAKAKFEEEEMKRIAEQRKQEKIEEKKFRAKIKAQIAQDRLDQQARIAAELTQASGPTGATTSKNLSSSLTSNTDQQQQQQPATKKTYDQCRIQIRLPGGEALVHTFNPSEQLSAVRSFTHEKHPELFGVTEYDDNTGFPTNEPQKSQTFMTTFPRRVFTEEDMMCSLEHLGQ